MAADGVCYIELNGEGVERAQAQTHRPLKRCAVQLVRAGLGASRFAVSQGTL